MPHRILLRDPERSLWLEFIEPLEVITASSPAEVPAQLELIEQRVQREGLHAAGYVSYEAASGFDAALITHPQDKWPLLSFGLFRKPVEHKGVYPSAGSFPPPEIWQIRITRSGYERDILRIKEQIERGNTYQVNYTIRAAASAIADPWLLFHRVAVDAPYASYLESDDYAIVSASPELFFRLDGNRLCCRPMKGTAKRGMTLDEDLLLRERLQASTKDRAENIMIADMIRNDVGRIAEPGSVTTSDLYRIEKYPTVWQMTSTVTAKTDVGVSEIFRSLFPCASVTGAPKVSSMRLIAGLETTPRHIYTGAIGYVGPERQAQFSVAIRSAFVDRKRQNAVYGVGGGIVWNSEAADEYDECLAKAQVLYRRRAPEDFELLETLLWSGDDGFFLLDRHIARLRASAEYFDFCVEERRIRAALSERTTTLGPGPFRVRLLVASDGECRTSAHAIEAIPKPGPTKLHCAANPVDANDPFLYHKTTWRDCYESAKQETGSYDDVLLWNGEGYVTETTVANVLIRIDGRLCTPPVDCGLLAGTYRGWLLEQGVIEERKIHVSTVAPGDEIFLINSVRGKYPALIGGNNGHENQG